MSNSGMAMQAEGGEAHGDGDGLRLSTHSRQAPAMTITIQQDCPATSTRRAYRIEWPSNARIYTHLQETILIPGPDHRKHPERSVWLRMEDAIRAAREGRYGLRLLSEETV